MKAMITVLFLASLFLVAMNTNSFGYSPTPTPTPLGPECSNGTKNDLIFYSDCFPRLTGETTDDERLQRAVNAAVDLSTAGNPYPALGKLILNERDYVLDTAVTLKSYLTIEGLGIGSPTSANAAVLHLTAANEAVFRIADDIHDVSVRDMRFRCDVGSSPFNTTGTIGIQIEPKASSPPTLPPTSGNLQFSGLGFEGFNYGIKLYDQSGLGWQVDTIHLENSNFASNFYGIYLDSYNNGWEMNNIGFSSAKRVDNENPSLAKPGQNGIHIERVGYISMHYIVGNGQRMTSPSWEPGAGEFIYIKEHGPVLIANAMGEAYKVYLHLDGVLADEQFSFRNPTVTIIDSALPGCNDSGGVDDTKPTVIISNNFVNSQGNYYACNGVARPVMLGRADVISVADKFCVDIQQADCFQHASGKRAEFYIKSNDATLKSDHYAAIGDLGIPQLELLNAYNQFSRPFLTFTSALWNPSGGGSVAKVKYSFTRNGTDGWLELEGSQQKPNTGYRFKNGPVELTSATLLELGTTFASVPQTGSLLFCSDCTAPSTPCSGSGSGALALRVGSAWHCK